MILNSDFQIIDVIQVVDMLMKRVPRCSCFAGRNGR